MHIKIEPTKLIGIAAAVVGVAATLLGNVSQQKSMKEEVAKQVAEALKN